MRVKLITRMAGPGGVAHPGQIINVDDAIAAALVAGGYAEVEAKAKAEAEVEAPPPEPGAVEVATVSPPERAVSVRRRRKDGR